MDIMSNTPEEDTQIEEYMQTISNGRDFLQRTQMLDLHKINKIIIKKKKIIININNL